MEESTNAPTDDDGIDRRGFLKCMAWAGTGMLWTVSGGVLRSEMLSRVIGGGLESPRTSDFQFVQISDSHIGFSKDANPDVVATLQAAVDRINGFASAPSLLLHTGDLSHLSRVAEYDTLDEVLKGVKTGSIFTVPGEHDMLDDNGKTYRQRYGGQGKGDGWYSFDAGGVHFIGLVNVAHLQSGGLGSLGNEQIEWLEHDVKGLGSSTPIVVFAHIPLWSVYPSWGWGTDDSARALSYVKRFGSVTVLNGHIHQTMQKVEGNVTFHTSMSTAFPQPAPGSAPSPGPMKVPAERLRTLLGVNAIRYTEHASPLAIVEYPLVASSSGMKQEDHARSADNATSVRIENFTFSPKELRVKVGTTVTWTNHDDMPHTVVAATKEFASPVLDTDQTFSFTFTKTGAFEYFCSIHAQMTGRVTVTE